MIERLSLARHLAGVLTALLLFIGGSAHAAPEADLWDRWSPTESSPGTQVDHGAWDSFLKGNLVAAQDGVNRIGYGAVTVTDRALLDVYLKSLSAVRPTSLTRPEAKAYWINLYNALTVRTVLDHYPVDSIRDIDISPGLFSNGPWGAELIEVEGVALTLDDIEHRILRPIWEDPRIHYALNCAAVGCPELRAEAWLPERLDAQLTDAARKFVNHPRALRVSSDGVEVSSIYDWFMEDFGDTDSQVIAHIRQYAKPDLAAQLARHDRIRDDFYDWTLNDAARAR